MRIAPCIILLAAMLAGGCNEGAANRNGNANANLNANASASVTPDLPKPVKPTGPVDSNYKPCNPYFPLVPNSLTRYTVTYSSGLIADATVVVSAADEGGRKVFTETSQIIDRDGGIHKAEHNVKKYVCDGERIQIISENIDNRIEGQLNVVEYKYRDPAITLVDPTSLGRPGTTWSYALKYKIENPGKPAVAPEEPVIVNLKVIGPEDLKVNAGQFKTLKIEREVIGNKIIDHYAKGIGLVKRAAAEGTIWELREYSGLSPAE